MLKLEGKRGKNYTKKVLTLVFVLVMAFSTFSTISPKVKAEIKGTIEAEDPSVQRFGSWEECERGVLHEGKLVFTTVLFTLGQNHEKLRFKFTGTSLKVRFVRFRTGIFNISIVGHLYQLVDTWSGDNWEQDIRTETVFSDLDDAPHTVELEATGLNNPNTCAPFLNIDAFIYEENADPNVDIILSADLVQKGKETKILDFSASDPDGKIAAWAVDFGDGTPLIWKPTNQKSISESVRHTYTGSAGYYNVMVWVKDNSEARAYAQRQIEVYTLPDLTINPWDITFTKVLGNFYRIDANVQNEGEATATKPFSVTFRSTTSQPPLLQTFRITSLSPWEPITVSHIWRTPQAGATIIAEVDSDGEIQEENETNNEASREAPGSEPVVTVITPYYVDYDGKTLPTTGFTALRMKGWSQNIRFEATVDDIDDNVDSVTFKLNGQTISTANDAPYGCAFDVATKLQLGENTLSAIAKDDTGYESDEYKYTIFLVEVPDWVVEFDDLDGLDLTFETGTLSYSIKFEKDLLEGKSGKAEPGQGKDDAVGGETGLEASVEVEVKLSLVDGTTTIRGNGEVKAQLFKKGLTGSIELAGTFSGTFELQQATINMHLELDLLEIPYKIYIPYIGDFGFTVTGTPHLDIDVKFEVVDDSFKPTSMIIKPGAELRASMQFGSLDGMVGLGVVLYGYVDGTIVVKVPDEPFLQLVVDFGVGAKYKVGGWSGKYKVNWYWAYPGGYPEDDPSGLTWKPEKTVGSNSTYGSDSVFTNLDFDDDPGLSSDSKGNALMVYVGNSTRIQEAEIYGTFWNKTSWSTPNRITNNTNYEMNPVVAFDSNDNAVALWTHNKNGSLTKDSGFDGFISSVKEFEIYYSLWNKSSWSTPKPITNDACGDSMPSVSAGKNGHVMATWVHDYDGNDTTKTDRDIFYSEWNGSAWSNPSSVANFAEADFNPNVACDSQNNAMVVWVHDPNSNASIFGDKPPAITNLNTYPNPGFAGRDVTVSVNATDDKAISHVTATINGGQTIDLVYNTTSDLYEGNFVPPAPGIYTIEILSNDTKGQKDYARITSEIELPYPTPVIRNPNTSSGLVYAGESALLSAEVESVEPLAEVSVEVMYPSGLPEKIYLMKGPGNQYLGILSNTQQTGTYNIQYLARNALGRFDHALITLETLDPGDQEIYYSAWNGSAWSSPSAFTNNYYEDGDPCVGFDYKDNPVVAFESFNGSTYEVYFTINIAGSWKPFERLSDQEWAMDPSVTVKNDIALITWRAYPNEWGDLYYRVLNTTLGGYDIGPTQRITDNSIVDWKQSVTLINGSALVTWLKHKVTVDANYTTYTFRNYTYKRIENFTLDYDDDDPYFAIIPILPDLTLDTIDIAFSNSSPSVNNTLAIKAAIHNRGDVHILNVPTLVHFYDGNPAKNGTLIGASMINWLMAGSQQSVETMWTPTAFGVHNIYVVADPLGIIRESSESNNLAYRSISVNVLTGNRTDKVETPYGNVTVRHADTVLLRIGTLMVETQFNGTGSDDCILIDGKRILQTEENGNVTSISALPSIQNVSFTHHTAAILKIHEEYVEASIGWEAVGDKVTIPSMVSTGEVVIDHSGAALLNITEQAVESRFDGLGTDEISISPMGISIMIKHDRSVWLHVTNVTDPQVFKGTKTENSIGKFINITGTDEFEWTSIKIYYSDEDVGALNESNLRMHYWNATTQKWTLIKNSGVDSNENYVWANVTRLGTFAPISVEYSVPTDLNNDGKVNIIDISIVAKAFGSKLGDSNWNEAADLNNDGVVNIIDISKVAKDFGKEV